MKNNTIFHGDNLPILKSMDSESIDLVYMDPPFNTGQNFAGEAGGYSDIFTRSEDVRIPPEVDWLSDAIDTLSLNYSAFMAWRLREIHRILKPTGYLFVHCDYREAAHLALLGHAFFTKVRFRGEIIWTYPTSYGGDHFSQKVSTFAIGHNNILWWEKSSLAPFFPLFKPYTLKQQREIFHHKDSEGRRFRTREEKGRERIYYDEAPGIPLTTVWDLKIASKHERTGYPTQKPLSLLKRIVQCSTSEGDVVLDPFCGSGTTLLAAKNLNRHYMGIDSNPEAVAIGKRRLRG